MGWAEALPSGRYRAMYRGPDRRKRNATPGITYTRKADAEREAGAREVDQRRPGALPPDAGKLTWGTWVETWWPRRRVTDSTRTRDLSRREHHLRPRWDNVPLAEITRDDVEAWVGELAAREDLSPSTVQRVYHLFSASMRAAALAHHIPASPCLSIPLERAPLPDEVFLTKAEVERITFYLNRPHKILVWLGAYTGLRWGELVALHRQRVDLDAGRVDVTLAWDTKNRAYKTPKNHERRSVPLPDWLVGELAGWFDALGPAHRCGVVHPPKLSSRCSSGLVVPGGGGVPTDYDSFRRNKWAPVVGRRDGEQWVEGLAAVDGPVTLHSLRHSYASWTLQAGVSIEQLAKLMGHASVLTTSRYAHLAQTRWDEVRGALDRPVPEEFGPGLPHDELAPRRTSSS